MLVAKNKNAFEELKSSKAFFCPCKSIFHKRKMPPRLTTEWQQHNHENN